MGMNVNRIGSVNQTSFKGTRRTAKVLSEAIKKEIADDPFGPAAKKILAGIKPLEDSVSSSAKTADPFGPVARRILKKIKPL